MYLPRSHAKKENIGPADEGDVDMPGGTETILVVDDEPKLLRSASKTLRSMGYSVYRAGDADQALETLKDKEDIDLLFSDVVMPGKMNGFELAKAALKKKPGLKVLMTSGFEQNFARKAPYFEFSKNLLTKPYRMIELATRVRATLDEGK